MIQRYASGALTNIATHGLETTPLSDEALAAVKLRLETKEAEERRSRYAMDIISLAVRAIPPTVRHRRAQSAKRRLASALSKRGGSGGVALSRSNSASSSRSSGSYFSACTSASGSGSSFSTASRDRESATATPPVTGSLQNV